MKINGKKKISLLLSAIGLFLLLTAIKAQTSCDSSCDSNDINCLNNLESLCQTKVTELQNTANTLSNQIAQFNAQIKLTTLKISQTQAQIALLGGRISQLGDSLNALTAAFSARAVETYKLSRFENNFVFLLTASDLSDAVTRLHYLQKIQEEDQSLLAKLQTAQTTYQGQKQTQEDLQKQLQAQQANLNTQKVAKNNLLIATKNDEVKYQSLLAQAIAQRNAFLGFVNSHGGASILNNQTVQQSSWPGYYYNQRDSQWGNSFMGSSQLTMADYGCLVTSVAMMATHAGKNLKPIDIANTPSAFFSPNAQTALLYWQFSVNGINVNLTSVPKSQLDQNLSNGPVIVGLYSGPDHYIVLKSGSNGNYIMNDPFLENGGDNNFGDKYSVSNITMVFTASFN
jgi:peptidoglycan hydrolase CwlO-like protein